MIIESDTQMSPRVETRISHVAASVVVVCLMAVPIWFLFTNGTRSLAWVVWAIVSIWATVNAVRLAVLAFPRHHKPGLDIGIALLAVVNVAFSLSAMLLPTG